MTPPTTVVASSATPIERLVARRRDLAAELAASRRDYGETRAAAIVAHSRAFRDCYDTMSITERNAYCKVVTADLESEVAKLHAECSALEAEIEQVDVELEYHDADS